ncbi:MAG TPA: LytR C-terminal domain-containing protein [Candidatus Humimicrobiaceae bacterium]|nr:LytR C-terminal domain-containing protein [Candidatus Humimicrobiaceae bacterium]
MIKTKAGSYVPESMVIKDGITEKSISRNVQNRATDFHNEPIKIQTAEVEKKRIEDNLPEEDNYLNEIPLEKSNKNIYLLGLIILVLVSIFTATIFFLRTKVPAEKSEEVALEVEESTATEQEASDTETGTNEVTVEEDQQLGRSDISVEILNGSGVSGLAGVKKEIFSDLGYNVVKIGNSAVTEGNKVYLQVDLEDKVDVLMDDLKEELDIASISGVIDGEEINARIILGK